MKAPKAKMQQPRHDPLHVQLRGDTVVESDSRKQRQKFVKRDEKRSRKDNDHAQTLDEKQSKKILQQAREQLEEGSDNDEQQDIILASGVAHEGIDTMSSDEEQSEGMASDGDEDFEPETFDLDVNGITAEDKFILSQFMPDEAPQRRNLAEMIMERFNEKSAAETPDDNESKQASRPSHIDPKIVEVYTKVGELMSKYKSGKIPKAFKVIPTLRNWEEILCLTSPENWTPHSMYQATRVFASNLKPKMAQRFFNVFLLDTCRNNIYETKKLNVHLYMALQKALYKPAAWFKGILFPLCGTDCTLREAVVFGSVLSKASIPVLHSAAALMKIAQADYTGANSIFIRILLDKKYALPYRVIEALVDHFARFKTDERTLPVLWHQALLVFCQRYKDDLSKEQKSRILDVVKSQFHYQITPEVRRELNHSSIAQPVPNAMEM
eukprot:Partr_v1_DN25378_c1_g1_i1_m21986 putative K14797 essential nuclear protein 1